MHATVRRDGAEKALKRALDGATPPRSNDGGRTLPRPRLSLICVPVHIDRPVLTVCSMGTSYRMQKGRSRSGRILKLSVGGTSPFYLLEIRRSINWRISTMSDLGRAARSDLRFGQH